VGPFLKVHLIFGPLDASIKDFRRI